MSVSVWHRGSKPCLGTCTFSSLLIGASNLRWNRRSEKSASNRCCKMSGGNKLPSGAVRLCGIASVNFHLKVSTLENQNSKGKNNNSNGRDGEKEELWIMWHVAFFGFPFLNIYFFLSCPFFLVLQYSTYKNFISLKAKIIFNFKNNGWF